MEKIPRSIIGDKVPESDERYQQSRKEISESACFNTSFLGGFDLVTIQNINNLSDYPDTSKLLYEKSIKSLRHKLENLLFYFWMFEATNKVDKEREKYICDELSSMFSASEIQEELTKHLGDDRSIYHLKKKIAEMSDELIYIVCKQHAENIKKEEAQLEEKIKEIKIEFKTAITEAVSNGILPEAVLNVLNRIDYIKGNLVDILIDINNYTLSSINDFGIIKVSNDLLKNNPKLKNILFHEFLHEISGKSITMIRKTYPNFHIDYHHYRKVGVGLQNEFRNQNTWLNEAITEWLALKLSGYEKDTDESAYKGSNIYKNERKELDRLIELGLEEDVLVEAYFENFSSEQQKDENGRYFSKLIQEINTIEGKYGFAKLENKYIFRAVLNKVMDELGLLVEDINIQKDLLSADSKKLKLNISVGKNQETIITKQFIYEIPFVNNEIIDIRFIKDKLRDLNLIIEKINKIYNGKVKITFSEE